MKLLRQKYIIPKISVNTTISDIMSIVSIITLFLMISTATTYSQQSQSYTQYLFNRFLLNPASCGADGYTSIGLVTKNQWVGFRNAPTNQVLTAEIRMPRDAFSGFSRNRRRNSFSTENIGLGAALFNDMRGPLRTTGGQLTYAYHLELRTSQLSFGLSTSLFQLFIDRDKIITELGHDIFLDANKLSSFIPEAAAGVHYTTRDYYVGAAASNLFQSYLTFGGRSSSDYRLEREYIFLGGYVFELNPEWSLVPGTQLKFTEKGAIVVDINALAYYFNRIWFGLSYRSGGDLGAIGGTSLMFGIKHEQYYFGYAFDYTLSNIQKYSYGSHELMVSYTFGQSNQFYRYGHRYEFFEQQYTKKYHRRRR